MSDRELIPNVNVTESSKLDSRSIRFLKDIFPDDLVDCSQLQEGGTLPNIDGYLDILCPDGTAREKVVVQVKHFTYPEKNGDVYYDIPQSIYAYAERHKGELVLFIACDYEHKKIYWRNISETSIEEFRNKSDHIQNTARYHFLDSEKCSENNVKETIELWRELYKKKMDSIKDDRKLADQFASKQRMCFNLISSELHGVKDSHIYRYQVDEVMQWITKDISRNEKSICLLAGDAGVGKSAVLKELISKNRNDGIKYLCIKADSIDDNGNPITLGELRDTLAYYSASAENVILIIDQIDALSQSLTNDRTHLNIMMAVLSSLEDWTNVKAVVSCRKYDLEYDSILNSLKDKSTIIEIGELSDEEVAMALDKLEEGLSKKVDCVTAKILRTVQVLNSFSILFQRNKSRINFNSQIELYDALWDTIILDSSSQYDVEIREQLMYKIAETIRKAGTLNPQFAPTSSQKQAYEYLASNGLIRREGCAVSFFHQSFYEYTLARHYSENNSLFATDIKKEIQGLEMRSMVKAVLDFKRGHDIIKFVEEARSILMDSDIRLHLKLLTLSVLAFVNNPSCGEKLLITEVYQKDRKMLGYFLRGVSSISWFPTIRNILNRMMPELRKTDEVFFPIMVCLSRYAFRNPEDVYGMINQIQDQESRLLAIAYNLREHNDYGQSCVLKAYAETKSQNAFFVINIIQDAIQSNSKFALEETEKLIIDCFMSEDSCNKHDQYELAKVLCPKLSIEYSKEMLRVLHNCICKTVYKTAQNGYYGFSTTKAFYRIDMETSNGKLLKIYEDLLIRYSPDETIVRPLVIDLLSLKNETTLSMAFTAMAVAPKLYDNLIRPLLENSEEIERYLHGDVEFFFLKMLRAWYDTLNENDAELYQRLLLSYKSEFDFKYDAARKWSRFLCPHLWWNKWVLICNTLPEDLMIPEMKRCYQELMRRFGRRYEVEKPDHSVIAGHFCGGVVSSEKYGRWPISNWLSSFLKLGEYKWREGRNPISLREHADAFKKCVTSEPNKFYDFVLEISTMADISDMYKVAGLEGLLAGGINPNSLWNLAELYITEVFAKLDSYTFSQIVEYYIKEENRHIDGIMQLCKTLTIDSFAENDSLVIDEDRNMDMSRRASDLLTRGMNSYQGRAAELLVHMCTIPSRRLEIYEFFTNCCSILHDCVKTMPLYYLNTESYFDEELYFRMLKPLLSGMGPEALYIRANAIQWCFYHKNDVVSNYINCIEHDFSSHELLVQIYFYGAVGGQNSEECEDRLEKILAVDNEDIVAKIVEIAMKSYVYAEYRDLSMKYLERYAMDNREKVVNAYLWYCNSLPIEAFDWYCGIVKTNMGKKDREIYNQLEYVKKCIPVYPVQSYKFISSQRYSDIDGVNMVDDEIVEILLEIYKKLSQDENEDAMNEILDLFDEYIYRDNRVLKNAVSLLS